MTHPRSTHAPRHAAAGGQSIVIFALALVVLVGMVGLGIDGARSYLEALRVQKAADQAALQAVVEGAKNGQAAAQGMADVMVARNLPVGSGISVIDRATLTDAYTLQATVTVTETGFPLFFGRVLGIQSAQIVKSSTAEYSSPGALGNPGNTLGDPTTPISALLPGGTVQTIPPGLSLAINGPDQYTESGDPYAPLDVLGTSRVNPLAATNPMTNPFPSVSSQPYDGYDYRVTVPVTNSTVYIQVYDAETCMVGDLSSTDDTFGDQLGTLGYGVPYTSTVINYPPTSDPSYTTYPTFFRFYKQDPLTGLHSPVPSVDYTSGSPRPVSSAGLDANVMISPTEGISGTSDVVGAQSCESPQLAPFTNRWYTLAKVDGNQGGTYVVNVTTCLDRTNINATVGGGLPSCRGSEVNNFALRAIAVDPSYSCSEEPNCQDPTPLDSSVQPAVSGVGRESVTVRSTGGGDGTATLFLSHVNPAYAGQWIKIGLYDPGDVIGSSSLQIVRPDGTYSPFSWYTNTLDGSGNVFTTTVQNNGSSSLITSYPASGLQGPTPVPPANASPTSTLPPVPTWTPTATPTPTNTRRPRPTRTPTHTPTPTSTAGPGSTPTPTPGGGGGPTNTPTPTPVAVPTNTPTPGAPTDTPTPRGPTATPTPVATPTPTATPTPRHVGGT